MRFGKAILLFLLVSSYSTAFSTSSIPPPTNINLSNNSQLQNEQQVFLCPTDSNIVIANWRDFRLGYRQVGIGRSIDGGITWVDSLVYPPNQYFGENSNQSDPTMSVDRFGNYVMCLLDYDAFGFTDGSVLAFYRSTDKGISWTGPVPNITTGQDLVFEDKQFITVDRTGGPHDGNIYCSWTRFGNPVRNPDRIMLVRSIDDAASFEDTVALGPVQTSTSCGGAEIDAGQFSIPIVNSNGDVHVFWMGTAIDSSSCFGPRTIKHVVSSDGGQTFSYEDTILTVSGYMTADGGVNIYSQPVGDADIFGGPFDGNLYLAFTNRGTEDIGNSDVDFIKSTDNGLTWSDRIQINYSENSELIDAFHPWLVCNEEGILACIFYDQRNDPPGYDNFDLFAAYSFDGGETFTTNHRITTVSSSPYDLVSAEDNFFDQNIENNVITTPEFEKSRAGLIGEYIGITAYHDKMVAVWTDSRDGNSETYSANWYLSILEPRLLSPENSEEFLFSPQLYWSTSWKNDSDYYRIEISLFSDFSADVNTYVTDTNYYSIDDLLANDDYYWRVKAFNIGITDSSEYSEVRSFTVNFEDPQCCINDRGNVNGDPEDAFDIADIVYFIEYVLHTPSGPAPVCFEEADVNADNSVDIADIVYLIDYAINMTSGAEPPKPCPDLTIFKYDAYGIGSELYDLFVSGWFSLIYHSEVTGEGDPYNPVSGTYILNPPPDEHPVDHIIGSGDILGKLYQYNSIEYDLFLTLFNNEGQSVEVKYYKYDDGSWSEWNYYDNDILVYSGIFTLIEK